MTSTAALAEDLDGHSRMAPDGDRFLRSTERLGQLTVEESLIAMLE